MKYKVNWIKTKEGNGIKAGNTLIVKITDARIVSGWIAKKTFYGRKMKQVGQSKNTLSFKLKERKGKRTIPYKKGNYRLKVSAFYKKMKNTQCSNEFEGLRVYIKMSFIKFLT